VRSSLLLVALLVAGSACSEAQSVADSPAPVATTTTTIAPNVHDDPAELWGRSFISRSITSGAVPVAIYDKVAVTVRFEQRGTGGVMQWHADCNFMGGSIAFDREHMTLTISEAGGTAKGCDADPAARDLWIGQFMLASPRWKLDNNTLILSTNDSAITFVPA
jgi:heat shock protein HslJ